MCMVWGRGHDLLFSPELFQYYLLKTLSVLRWIACVLLPKINWEKIFANNISKIEYIKNFVNSIVRKHPIFLNEQDLNRCFTKEDIQLANEHLKNVQHRIAIIKMQIKITKIIQIRKKHIQKFSLSLVIREMQIKPVHTYWND